MTQLDDTITDNSVVYFVVRNNNIDKKWKYSQSIPKLNQ